MKRPILRTVQAGALVASGLARAAGELVQISAGAPTPLSGTLAVLALLAFAMGLTGIWAEARHTLTGRVATIATIIGALSFVALALHALLVLGTPPTHDVARTVPFALSALATLIGVTALALFLLRSPHYHDWIAAVLLSSVAGSVITSVLNVPSIVQPLIDIVMAVSFLQFGLALYRAPDPAAPCPALRPAAQPAEAGHARLHTEDLRP